MEDHVSTPMLLVVHRLLDKSKQCFLGAELGRSYAKNLQNKTFLIMTTFTEPTTYLIS